MVQRNTGPRRQQDLRMITGVEAHGRVSVRLGERRRMDDDSHREQPTRFRRARLSGRFTVGGLVSRQVRPALGDSMILKSRMPLTAVAAGLGTSSTTVESSDATGYHAPAGSARSAPSATSPTAT
jgi:hypothetical protein